MSEDSNKTYWSAAISHLPPEERDKAWRLLTEIQEEEEGFLPKFFLVLKCHGLYMKEIPSRHQHISKQNHLLWGLVSLSMFFVGLSLGAFLTSEPFLALIISVAGLVFLGVFFAIFRSLLRKEP